MNRSIAVVIDCIVQWARSLIESIEISEEWIILLKREIFSVSNSFGFSLEIEMTRLIIFTIN